MTAPATATERPAGKNILITGASGLIGTALGRFLRNAGYRVCKVRRNSADAPFYYLQDNGVMHLDPSIPLHAVINLAGANISDRRWNAGRKREIIESRTVFTHSLCQALARLPRKPQVLLSASAIGFYGADCDGPADEMSPAGNDFLAEVARQWEQATSAAEQAGIRTVHLRLGLVLSPDGGVLKNLILPLRLGVVGRIGSGEQYLSWISIDDVLRIVLRALQDDNIAGPVNLVSNQHVTNAEFSKALARTLHRFRLPPLPAFAVRLMFGEMADAALLAGARINSIRLKEHGIVLRYPDLDDALKALFTGQT